MRQMLLVLAGSSLTGCSFNVDSMIWNGRHCSIVGPDTCDVEEVWDQVCATCDDAYDWDTEYEWFDETLTDGQTVRAIDPDSVENYRLQTTDGLGELDLYFIPSHGEDSALADTLFVQNHGNFASIEHYLPRTRYLHEYGVDILVWDYRGYGKSEPDSFATADQFMADAGQVLEYAGEIATDASRIVIYGQSIGGIPATEQAVLAEAGGGGGAEPCALILETPFPSASEVALSVSGVDMPGGFLTSGHYENDEKLARYSGPLLAMAATEDARFPPENVQPLVDAATGPKSFWILEGAHHGIADIGVPEFGLTDYFDHMDDFFSELAPGCVATE